MHVTNSSHSFFITGTDTGVGKTVITGAVLVALQQQGKHVGILKPIETGVTPHQTEQSDVSRLRRLMTSPPPSSSMCLYRFEAPLAPLSCSRATGIDVDLSKILQQVQALSQQHDMVLIEGAGGLLTPLTATNTILDLIVTLQLPCLMVGRTDLGAVNHTLLSLQTLQRAGIPTQALVLNEPSSDQGSPTVALQRGSSVELIREFAHVTVVGPLGYEEIIQSDWEKGVRQLAGQPEIQRLAMSLVMKGAIN